jgi:hypothetical protein
MRVQFTRIRRAAHPQHHKYWDPEEDKECWNGSTEELVPRAEGMDAEGEDCYGVVDYPSHCRQ